MHAFRSRHAAALCAAVAGLATTTGEVGAGLIQPGLYLLHNHPDGSLAPPSYGLRLDELFDVTPEDDHFTFDFDHPDADVFLEYDGTSIHIFGTAFGGLQAGDDYDPAYTSLVVFDFVYGSVGMAPGDDDLLVTTPNFTDTGSITWLATGETFGLWNRNNDEGFSFRMGNEDDDLGHRGFPGISGWGWLDHTTPGGQRSPSDWIFTAEQLPGPPVLAVLGMGLLGCCPRRHR